MANKTKVKPWKIVVSLLILCALGYKQSFASHQTTIDKIESSNYYVSYIDVGQGNSSFVQLPDGKNVLIDGGDKEFGETVEEFLNDRNVTQIDYMIATHADSDHIAGLNHILEKFEIKNVLRPLQISMTSDGEVYEHEDLKEAYEYMQTIYGENPKVCKTTTAVYREFIK